jgi:hypothetical protein
MRGVGVHRRTLAIRKERIESANGISRPDREPRPVVTLAYPGLEANPRLCGRFFGGLLGLEARVLRTDRPSLKAGSGWPLIH